MNIRYNDLGLFLGYLHVKKSLYRITFANQEAIYEIYARKVCESEIFGFLEVEDFVLVRIRPWLSILLKSV